VGWALPAYLSFKALETPGHQDDIQWLTYWVVFGFFNFLESFALRIVLYYFPWYFAFKTVFILWLQLPAFRVRVPSAAVTLTRFCSSLLIQGAQVTYLSILKPVLSNISSQASAAVSSQTTTAEGLRERVNTATSE
jgi:receptor expression-enhancing protein 5/6